jgi:hypothetical protein
MRGSVGARGRNSPGRPDLLSKNTKDFGGTGGRIHPDLDAEMGTLGVNVIYCPSPEKLFAELGARQGRPLAESHIANSEEAALAIVRAVEASRDYLSALPTHEPLLDVLMAVPPTCSMEKVVHAQSFIIDDRTVDIAKVNWRIEMDLSAGLRAAFAFVEKRFTITVRLRARMIFSSSADSPEVQDAEVLSVDDQEYTVEF